MKYAATIFCLLVLTFSLFAQKPPEVLATAANKKFTAENLRPEVRDAWLNLPNARSAKRAALLEKQIGDELIASEAAAQKISIEKFYQTEIAAKIQSPTDAQISAVYEANRARIGDRSLSQVREQIIEVLRREPEEKLRRQMVAELKIKYKLALIKNVNQADLKSSDVLARMNGKTITVQDFENRNKRELYDLEADVFEAVREDLRAVVAAELLETEAAELKISSSDILAREITDKLREYTPDERERLQAALDRRLFAKYKPQFSLAEPEPFVEQISVDGGDPALGAPGAPVTVVMFSDFQCSYCAATHPVLKRVLAEYGDKVRFVVRDFPLESIHPDAFRAALAANAAHAQGKFFEYIELLYQNQNALDDASLKKYAADLGLNPRRFELDLGNEKFAAEVRQDLSDGRTYGIGGTPTIFVNGVKVRNYSAGGLRRAIERASKK